jgi:hypothetical protein
MYVYFEPQGGWNDILSTLESIIEYCSTYNRILLLNGKKSEYRVNLSTYIQFSNPNIICDTEKIESLFVQNPDLSIYPSLLQGRMIDILQNKIQFQYGAEAYLYNGVALDLPRETKREDVIVFSRCGMGRNGYDMFRTLLIQPLMKEICKERYKRISKPYLCIQIRNTDYKCDYDSLYNQYKDKIHSYESIYLATDDKNLIEYFRSKGLSIYNFTTYPDSVYYNLHASNMDPDIKFQDLIADIYILGMSREIISSSIGGFIQLIQSCHVDQAHFAQQFS